MDSPTQQLEKWARKHYRYTIRNHGNVMPGDGTELILEAAGRKVSVFDEDYQTEDRPALSLDELILEGLRQWHADTKPKNFEILFEADAAPASDCDGIMFQEWVRGSTVMAYLVARNEQEAVDALRQMLANNNIELVMRSVSEAYYKGPFQVFPERI